MTLSNWGVLLDCHSCSEFGRRKRVAKSKRGEDDRVLDLSLPSRRAMPADADALATLSAIFPTHSSETLERYLAASSNSLERATEALLNSRPLGPSTKRRRVGGLDKWLHVAELAAPPQPPPAKKEAQRSAFDLLRPPSSTPAAAPAPLPPLVLSTPALVSQHTGGLCTLIENVLPKELAARLFLRMMRESAGEGGPGCASFRWPRRERKLTRPCRGEKPLDLVRPRGGEPAHDLVLCRGAGQRFGVRSGSVHAGTPSSPFSTLSLTLN